MKHHHKVVFILILIFLLTQVFGLFTVSKYLNVTQIDGKNKIEYPNTVVGEAPEIEDKSYTFIYMLIGILVATAILLFFIKIKIGKFWKYWFFISVWIAMTISFGIYVGGLIAVLASFILSILKIYRPNFYIHNLTEIFIYCGIVILFLPIINLFSAIMLLIFISIYDYIAVFKTKHMVKLAKFQSESNVFAGISIPYEIGSGKITAHTQTAKAQKSIAEKSDKHEGKVAILGGGDIAFPLMFSSAVMMFLIENINMTKTTALMYSFVIAVTSTASLLFLLYYGKKDKFYPAMPILSAGCFIGFGIMYLLYFLISLY